MPSTRPPLIQRTISCQPMGSVDTIPTPDMKHAPSKNAIDAMERVYGKGVCDWWQLYGGLSSEVSC
jgi:hypothetical protein